MTIDREGLGPTGGGLTTEEKTAWNVPLTMEELMIIMDAKTNEIAALKRECTDLTETNRQQLEALKRAVSQLEGLGSDGLASGASEAIDKAERRTARRA
jgi:hypothetical protein